MYMIRRIVYSVSLSKCHFFLPQVPSNHSQQLIRGNLSLLTFISRSLHDIKTSFLLCTSCAFQSRRSHERAHPNLYISFRQLALDLRANISRRRSNLPLVLSGHQVTYFFRLHFFPTCDMGDQSASTHVQTLFEPALQAYERKTGVALSTHPLTGQLQDCHTVESITTLLQGQARDFSDLRRNDRLMKVIKSVTSILSTLSATSALGESTGLVRQKSAECVDGTFSV